MKNNSEDPEEFLTDLTVNPAKHTTVLTEETNLTLSHEVLKEDPEEPKQGLSILNAIVNQVL
jgi:hypothetical protein